MEPTLKKAVIYCRVSTREQVDEGNSLFTQEKICKEYAVQNGYEISEIFIEQGESAKTTERTELQRLVSYCTNKQNKIAAVIAYKIDRISRNTDDYSQIRLVLKRFGVEIKSTSEYFENTPAGKFMENIIANVAQFDNDVRTERSVNGMKEAVRDGRYVWKAPLGYKNVRIGGKATISKSSSAAIIERTFIEVAQNIQPLDRIRNLITNPELKQQGENLISKTQFYRMLKNKVYAGIIEQFGERHNSSFEPIVQKDIFEHVQKNLKSRKRHNKIYQKENPDFPLRRFFYHPAGGKLTGAWARGRSKMYPFYRYHNPQLHFRKEVVEAKFKQILTSYGYSNAEYRELKDAVHENLVKKNKSDFQKANEYRLRKDELQKKESLIIEKNHKQIISDSILKRELDLIENEIIHIDTSLLRLSNVQEDFGKILDAIKEILINPYKIWLAMPFELKVQLQWFYFPEGIQFDGINCQTTKVCSLFKLKETFSTTMWHVVTSGPQITIHPEVVSNKTILPHNDLRERKPENLLATSGSIYTAPIWDEVAEELIKISEDLIK
ncbi:MAG: hypothetical protein JWP69_560 [Flaviaesturariibacter sp.]|nr:hypothetical protein [Flaviaesturariibacter sp.]